MIAYYLLVCICCILTILWEWTIWLYLLLSIGEISRKRSMGTTHVVIQSVIYHTFSVLILSMLAKHLYETNDGIKIMQWILKTHNSTSIRWVFVSTSPGWWCIIKRGQNGLYLLYSICSNVIRYLWYLINQNLHVDGILPKWPYPPCLRMTHRALLAGYPRCVCDCLYTIMCTCRPVYS